MTELQWLIHMLTKHKLSSALKDLFIERIGEVEAKLSTQPQLKPRVNIVQQAIDNAMQVDRVAQTAEAQRALQDRQLAIKVAASGKPEPGRTSPRKF